MVAFPRMERAFLAEGFAQAKVGSLRVHAWLRNESGWAVHGGRMAKGIEGRAKKQGAP